MSKDDISHELNLLYEVNKDSLVSIACFSENGELLGAVPVGNVKNNVDVTQQSWFTTPRIKWRIFIFQSFMCKIFLKTAMDAIIG